MSLSTSWFMWMILSLRTGNDSQFLDHFVNALSKKISNKDLGILYHFLGVEVIPTPTDSDWGGVNNSGRSTTAYILYLGTNIISWKSTRQKSVSRSFTEAEYYKALANASAELCWTKTLLHTNHTPTLFCDNTGVTYLCANPVYHSRMKHVALDYHFVREQVSAGQLRVLHISSQDQLANMLTKPLTRAPFLRNRSKIGFLDHFVNALSKKISIKDLGILYHFLGVEVIPTSTDSDWGGVNNSGRSTTAYILYLGTNIISWKSTRQKSVSRSFTEAEYYKALANASAELCWTKTLLHTNHTPTLFCDNTGVTYLCANPVYHSRMKHVALDYHFVREQVSAGQLRVLHISSQDQLANMLTKPLTRAPFLRNRSKIGVSNGSSILRGGVYKE
nr:putative LRR receptor kinase [Tanacetum cinerariifolium]